MKQLLTNFIGTFRQIEKAIGSGEEREGKRRKREGEKGKEKKGREKGEKGFFFFPIDFGIKGGLWETSQTVGEKKHNENCKSA